jgi:hypothetical protein
MAGKLLIETDDPASPDYTGDLPQHGRFHLEPEHALGDRHVQDDHPGSRRIPLAVRLALAREPAERRAGDENGLVTGLPRMRAAARPRAE